MSLSNLTKPVGILGVGSFGTVIANNIALHHDVLVYARKEETVNNINNKKKHRGIAILDSVRATQNIEDIALNCDLIFPVVPSYAFRSVIQEINPYLNAHHIFIHCTKGFDVQKDLNASNLKIVKNDINTMSELIINETPVYRVGCMSGPNLSKEIAEKQPAGSVVASHYKEVRQLGIKVIK